MGLLDGFRAGASEEDEESGIPWGELLQSGLQQGIRASGWTAPQDLLGYGVGAYKSGSLVPESVDETGRYTWNNPEEQAAPLALGRNLIVPEGHEMSPAEDVHEKRHDLQSQALGPAYVLASRFGGPAGEASHILEEDARSVEPDSPEKRMQEQFAASEEDQWAKKGFLEKLGAYLR